MTHRAGLPPTLLAVFAIVLLLPAGPSGGAAGSPSFAEFVRRSDTILSGTVERTWVEMDRRVHARVLRAALTGVRVVKGTRMDRPFVSIWPAETGGGLRELRRGDRYIFFLSKSPDTETTGYSPILASQEGVFPVLYDSSLRIFLVHDWKRRPLVMVGWRRLTVVDAAPSEPRAAPREAYTVGPWLDSIPGTEDPRTRVSEEDFLRVVRGFSGVSGASSNPQ